VELLAREVLTGYLALSLVVNYSWGVVVKSNLEGQRCLLSLRGTEYRGNLGGGLRLLRFARNDRWGLLDSLCE
jgi:hypothetical protein